MNILIAPDSFKDCLSAKEVALAIRKGLLRVQPEANVSILPMADGGEGFVQAMIDACGGQEVQCDVLDPLLRPIKATYGLLAEGVAVIEMAEASGIERLSANELNPLVSSSYGTGQLMLHAASQGAKKIIIGIGGSATNDGGTGMARALGYRFLDEYNKELPDGGGYLDKLVSIDNSQLKLKGVELVVACDVTNPLCGEHGASFVYGPQKGANAEMVRFLDANLYHLAMVVQKDLKKNMLELQGGGAAGGLGAGLFAFVGAKLQSGFDIVKQESKLQAAIKQSQLVFTGEGKMDFQSKQGKTPWGVAQLAKQNNIPVVGIAGSLGENYSELYSEGFTSLLALPNGPASLDYCIENADALLADTAEQALRLIITHI